MNPKQLTNDVDVDVMTRFGQKLLDWRECLDWLQDTQK
jgi:hypothetical protein